MEWIQLIISMIGIIGLIFFLFYLMKKVNKSTSVMSGSRLKIIDRASLGRDSILAVVCVCGKLMLVGVSTGRIEKICDLPVTEEEYINSVRSASTPVSSVSFSDILNNIGIKRKKYKDEKEDFSLSDTPNIETEIERECGTDENASDCNKTE